MLPEPKIFLTSKPSWHSLPPWWLHMIHILWIWRAGISFWKNSFICTVRMDSRNAWHLPKTICRLWKSIPSSFCQLRVIPNLTRLQIKAQEWLLNHLEVIVLSADKILGSITMDRSVYLNYAYHDHLKDSDTYKKLSVPDKNTMIAKLQNRIKNFWIIPH